MAISLVGTPLVINSGANYTRESGSNRVVVFIARAKSAPSQSLTNISYNSNTLTPIVQGQDNALADRNTVAICVAKESQLPAGAASVTATWSGAISGTASILCMTFDAVEQTTTVRTSASDTGIDTAVAVALSGLTVGDACVGGYSNRNGDAVTLQNAWTAIDNFTNGDGGVFASAYTIADASSETLGYTFSADDHAAAALALIPVGGAPTESTITPAKATLTLDGRAATINVFTNVAIRDVLINGAGSPVANRTGISVLVWYGAIPVGVPDLSYSALTSDANGSVSWNIATGSLVYNQAVFYLANDGHASLSEYTCARIVPLYS